MALTIARYQRGRTTTSPKPFADCPPQKEGSSAGRKVRTVGSDRETPQIEVVRCALEAKFRQNDCAQAVLILTGDRPIREHRPHDAERGWLEGEGRGLPMQLLVELRSNLRKSAPGERRPWGITLITWGRCPRRTSSR